MLAVLAPAVAAALVIMAVLAWQQPRLPGRRDMSLCMLIGAAFFLYKAFPDALAFGLPVVLVGPLVSNRAYRAAFETRARPMTIDLGLLMVMLVMGFLAYAGPHWMWAQWGFSLISLYLFLELPVMVWRGLPDDLVEARRNARLWMLGLGAVIGALVCVGAVVGQSTTAVSLGAAATLALCVAVAGFGKSIVATLAPVQAEPQALDDRERQVLRRLRHLMREEQIFRDPGLSLSRLAQTLDVPEHRLRRVIHIGEDQRNFSAYLNALRIVAVKVRLDSDETILALALEAGYTSLSVFNRAFKATEGVTPTAFRAALTARTTPNTAKTAAADSEAGKA
ncbi:helix-turn-helix domain-containing protein [Asticcacaulis sp. AC466]|uniref:helix-turn-helix domain-containing protein n=1 Tax=Asticcacaulis sp. AC466 TaxID=1282362 RepID=UPI0004269338|nr:AraC family transcriptional regulator [Asticcacaulis sp. AC466]